MFDKIMSEWEQDAYIDNNKISEETLKSPNLHQKYLQFLLQYKSKFIKIEHELKKLKFTKYKYYRGELTREELSEYGWHQYQGIKPLKSDMNFILETDSDILDLTTKLKYLENCISSLESILNQIKQRDWMIKNFIEWTKFQSGN